VVSALVLWMLGFPDRAEERASRAVALATDLGHPFTLAYALFHSGFLHLWRREPEAVLDRAVRVPRMADEHDLQIWRALGTCLLGAANAGNRAARGGHCADPRRAGPVPRPQDTSRVLAAASLRAGRGVRPIGKTAEGLDLIDDAIEIAGSELTPLPEFYLLKGNLLLGAPDANGSAAESWFQRAFDVAHGLDARMPQTASRRQAVRSAA